MFKKDKNDKKDDIDIALENLTPPESVEYFVYRLEMEKRDKEKKRLWKLIVGLIIALFVETLIIAGFGFYEAQMENYVFTNETEQTTDSGGDNQNSVYFGDYNGNNENKNNDQKAG